MTPQPADALSDEELENYVDNARRMLSIEEFVDPVRRYVELLFRIGSELQRRRSGLDPFTVEACAKVLDLRAQDILLIAGGMTAQELRSVRAMLNERARAIRALSGKPIAKEGCASPRS